MLTARVRGVDVAVTLTIAMACCSCVVLVKAQCDPWVCSNPSAYQLVQSVSGSALPPAPAPAPAPARRYSTMRSSGSAVGGNAGANDGDDVPVFESLMVQLHLIPNIPTQIDPALHTQYYVSFSAMMGFSNPSTSGVYPVTLTAALVFDAAVTRQYVAVCTLVIGGGGTDTLFNGTQQMAVEAFSPMQMQLVNGPGGLGKPPGLTVWAYNGGSGENAIDLASGFEPVTMQSGAQATVGMLVTNPNGLNQTTCAALPANPNSLEFFGLSLTNANGTIPLALQIANPSSDWCELQVTADDANRSVTFTWGTDTGTGTGTDALDM